ncbi:5-carboxymethyl-2-hydroxymuconate isomerase [Achromatium sp. WMS2]|nr:5-carboxymethyl-2-hydroxymuconate isomerase [Achromatium sp. WMS2]
MRIVHFLDPDGQETYGIPDNVGGALRLTGELFQELVPTTNTVKISKLLAPLVPCNIFGIGLNYSDHAIETGANPPEHPIIFMKPTSSLNASGAPIYIPKCCNHGLEVDYEAELAVVVGKTVRDVSEQQALDCVFGYTIANDISARRWQKHGGGGQWVRGKSFDGFCPLGPVLVTADELPDPQNLGLRSRLNNVLMQNGNTRDMLFSVSRLISLLSQDTTLLPGTVILTGTPAGVGFGRTPPVFLQPGDSIIVEIDGIGSLENNIM